MGQIRGDHHSIRTHVERMRRRLIKEAMRAREDMAKTSTVPSHALDLDDPMLEAALTDSAMQFFLQHMTAFDNESGAEEADITPYQEAIPVEELRQIFGTLAHSAAGPPPDLHAGLAPERFWILLDLVNNGDALSQHRATLELREIMASAQHGELDAELAQTYLDGLRNLPGHAVLVEVLIKSLDEMPHQALAEHRT